MAGRYWNIPQNMDLPRHTSRVGMQARIHSHFDSFIRTSNGCTPRCNAKSRGLPPARSSNALTSRTTPKWRLWSKLLNDAVHIPAFRSMVLTCYVIWPWPSKLPRRDLHARVCHVIGYIIERRWVRTDWRHERIRIWKEAVFVLSQHSRDADITSVRINDNVYGIRIGLLRRAVHVIEGWWSVVWPVDTALFHIVCILYLDMSYEQESSVVGIETGYGLDDRRVGVRVTVGSRIFSFPRRPDGPDCLWGPPNLLSHGYGSSFPGGKAAGAWSWTLTFN
jgi:hypothetical protein